MEIILLIIVTVFAIASFVAVMVALIYLTRFAISLVIVTVLAIICTIRDYINARKPVDTKLGEQRIRDITSEDLGYSIPCSNVPVPDTKCVVEE